MHDSCIRTARGRVEFLLFALFRLFHFGFNLVQVDFGGWKQIYYNAVLQCTSNSS